MHPALGLAWTSALVPGRGGRWAGLRFGVAAEGVPGSAQSQPRAGVVSVVRRHRRSPNAFSSA